MRILIAPDSFKGSLSAVAAADAIRQGAAKVFPDAVFDCIPIADGGEGTVEALVSATNGTLCTTQVRGPMGTLVDATWGLLDDGQTAVIEMAAASGLPLVALEERDVLHASSYGTGQLMVAALEKLHTVCANDALKTPKLFLGIGGSATNDCGAGVLQALGIRLINAAGQDLPAGGAALSSLASIDDSNVHPLLAKTAIFIACDVDNPLCGPQGASAVFGPQKGATPEQVEQLDNALGHFAYIAEQMTGKHVAKLPGAGAAGGLGAGLLFFTEARLCSGVDLVLDFTDFDTRVRNADIVVTGEGNTDFQTAHGKAPVGVAKRAKMHSKPVICISGGLGRDYESIHLHGIDAAASVVASVTTIAECMTDAGPKLEKATERAFRMLKAGMALSSS